MALTPFRLLAWLSALMFGVRMFAANRVGFGDAEALYASYAWFPQPAYLDHPGLIGDLGRVFSEGGAPSPVAAHNITAGLATLVPILGMIAARLAGASEDRAPLAGLALLAAPEIAVGLFGFTPDVLLAPLWLVALGLVCAGVRWSGTRALFAFVFAGGAMGLACDAKVSGFLLPFSLLLFLMTPPARPIARTPGPWLALAMCALLVSPVLAYEAKNGFPLIHHRLVSTQAAAGFSLRNAGALVGGQLAYLSPIVAIAAGLLLRNLWTKSVDAAGAWLRVVTTVPLVTLAVLCLWSRVAEPHWMAPAWLGLAIHFSREPSVTISRRLARLSFVTGMMLTVIAHVWVLSDLPPRLLGRFYEARYDLANDMHVWARILPALRRERTSAEEQFGAAPVIVAPHWTIAAQVAAALEKGAPVTTTSDVPDDFQMWLPTYLWDRHPVVLYVTDDRFPDERPAALANRSSAGLVTINVLRGGRVVRRARLEVLVLSDSARNENGGPLAPAAPPHILRSESIAAFAFALCWLPFAVLTA